MQSISYNLEKCAQKAQSFQSTILVVTVRDVGAHRYGSTKVDAKTQKIATGLEF